MLAVFLDQETTGLDPAKHAVIEVAFKIVNLATCVQITEFQSVIKVSFSDWEKRDPDSIEINKFCWDEIQSGNDPDQVGREIIKIFNDAGIERGRAIFICQNPAFDRPFFAQLVDIYTHEKHYWPYHWLDLASMYWMLRMRECQQREEEIPFSMNLSKDEIAKYYHLPPEQKPHRAMNGVDHLILCFEAVIGSTENFAMLKVN